MWIWEGHKHSEYSRRLKQQDEYKALIHPLFLQTQMELISWLLLSLLLFRHLTSIALYCLFSFYVYSCYLSYQIINSLTAESFLFLFSFSVLVVCCNAMPYTMFSQNCFLSYTWTLSLPDSHLFYVCFFSYFSHWFKTVDIVKWLTRKQWWHQYFLEDHLSVFQSKSPSK